VIEVTSRRRPKVTGGSLYRPWGACHDGAIEPSTAIRLGGARWASSIPSGVRR
jgi:hypothetical protein